MPHTTAVVPGKGTLLQVSISSVFTTVAQRVSLDGPDRSVGTAETTTLDSTAKTFRATIVDNGTVGGKLYFDPQDATHLYLIGLVDTPGMASWKLTVPDADATVFAFSGILTKLKMTGMEVEGNLEAEFEIKISGAVTHTP